MIRKKQRQLTSFGVLVKKALVEKGMTQVQLAEKVGTSKKYLNLIFHGERSGKKYLQDIVDLLGLESEYILQSAWKEVHE